MTPFTVVVLMLAYYCVIVMPNSLALHTSPAYGYGITSDGAVDGTAGGATDGATMVPSMVPQIVPWVVPWVVPRMVPLMYDR